MYYYVTCKLKKKVFVFLFTINKDDLIFFVYLTDIEVEDRFVGCFSLEENTFSDKKFELINTNVPEKCSAICHNLGYLFSGVER